MNDTVGTCTDIIALRELRDNVRKQLEREPDRKLLQGYLQAIEQRMRSLPDFQESDLS